MRKIFIILILTLIILPCKSFAFKGIVLGISGSDTIVAKLYGRQVFVKLYGIEPPAKGQSFSIQAESFLGRLKGKSLEFVKEQDHIGNTVSAFVYLNGVNINEEMIKKGLAWVDPSKCSHIRCKNWVEMEKSAKEKKEGLWKEENPISPWEFRAKNN